MNKLLPILVVGFLSLPAVARADDVYINGHYRFPIHMGMDAGVLFVRDGWAQRAAEDYAADNADAVAADGAMPVLPRASLWGAIDVSQHFELGIEGSLWGGIGPAAFRQAFGGSGMVYLGWGETDEVGTYRQLRLGAATGSLTRVNCGTECSFADDFQNSVVFSRRWIGPAASIEVGKTLHTLPLRVGIKAGATVDLTDPGLLGFDATLTLSLPY